MKAVEQVLAEIDRQIELLGRPSKPHNTMYIRGLVDLKSFILSGDKCDHSWTILNDFSDECVKCGAVK